MNCRRMGVSHLLRVLYCINFPAVCQWKLLRRHPSGFITDFTVPNIYKVYMLYRLFLNFPTISQSNLSQHENFPVTALTIPLRYGANRGHRMGLSAK